MIKVLHIIKSLGRGGAEMLLPETLKLHRKDVFDFHYLYFLPWKDQMVRAIEENGGKVTCLNAGNNIRLMLKAWEVADYVRRNNIQLIHAHLPWAGIVARAVGKMTGVPVIYTEHNKQERYHFLTRHMNLLTMDWLSEVIAVSEDVERSLRKHKPGLKASLKTVLNGVNIDHFRPGSFDGADIRRQLNIAPDAPVIGTIAVFRFQKRLEVWLDIASRVIRKIPEARFVIVGDGPLRDPLQAKCRELGMEHAVHFAGLQTEVRPFLAAFDLYMMSSVFEGLPIAMLEAMACECPVISTDAGGIKEVIRNGRDGLLCPVSEAERLVVLATDLIRNQEKRKKMAMQGRKRVEQSFSLARMVNELEAIYGRTLDLPSTYS